MRISLMCRLAAVAVVTAVAGGVVVGPANALTIPKQIDGYEAVTHRAAMGGLVTFDQDFGSTQIKGNVAGTVTYNAPIADFKAGCARVRIVWRSASGNLLHRENTTAACSSNGVFPSVATFSKTFKSPNTRRVDMSLRVKQFNQSEYSTVATRSIAVG